MKRYTKYDNLGALHWRIYNKKRGRYYHLVNDTLVPFEKINSGTLLDVGCGDGVSGCLLAQRGLDVTGVDIEEMGIKYAKELCKEKVNWVCQDIENFRKHCLEKEIRFDYLYSLNTIEHLERGTVIMDLMDIVDKFAVICTDDESMKSRKGRYHTEEYTRESFQKLFKNFKLEEISVSRRYFCYKVYAKSP